MNIAVTGANGYIGSHVVRELLNQGHSVTATDISGNNIDSRANIVLTDIFKTQNVFETLNRPDALIHLAWRNGFNHSHESHINDLPGHYTFLRQIIDSGCKSVSVMGSMHEIGYHVGEINDTTPCNPMSLYGISKNALRQMLAVYATNKDVSLKWLRAFYITGDDKNNKSIFAKILEMAAAGQKTFPFTTGTNQYDFTDIDILAKYIVAVATQNKVDGIINVCSGKPVALRDKVESFIQQNKLGIRPEYGAFPDRQYDSPCIYGNTTKLAQIIIGQKAQEIQHGKNL